MTSVKIPFQSSAELIGIPVRDISDEIVGCVSDLIVDTEEGRVAYIGIDLECASNPANRRVVVPWSALQISGQHAGDWRIAARRDSLDRIARPADDEP